MRPVSAALRSPTGAWRARTAARVPPPRFHFIRYHGVLAPAAAWRPLIIPQTEGEAPPSHPGCSAGDTRQLRETVNPKAKGRSRPRNYAWAERLRRVFSTDILVCDRCGARMRVLCAVNPPDAVRKILDCLRGPSDCLGHAGFRAFPFAAMPSVAGEYRRGMPACSRGVPKSILFNHVRAYNQCWTAGLWQVSRSWFTECPK